MVNVSQIAVTVTQARRHLLAGSTVQVDPLLTMLTLDSACSQFLKVTHMMTRFQTLLCASTQAPAPVEPHLNALAFEHVMT